MNTDIKEIESEIQREVQEIINITPSTFLIRLDKKSLNFHAGQYIVLSIPGNKQAREYSIYSGENEPTLDILIKEVYDGYISRLLKNIKTGESLKVEGPFGHFVVSDEELKTKKFLFIASGTGISPFHSFIKSYPQLNYTLLHGVKEANEAYGKEDYDADRYILCTSQNASGDFEGRVTDYLLKQRVDLDTICYLCGNSAMIDDVYDILEVKGVPTNNIRAEVYF